MVQVFDYIQRKNDWKKERKKNKKKKINNNKNKNQFGAKREKKMKQHFTALTFLRTLINLESFNDHVI